MVALRIYLRIFGISYDVLDDDNCRYHLTYNYYVDNNQ